MSQQPAHQKNNNPVQSSNPSHPNKVHSIKSTDSSSEAAKCAYINEVLNNQVPPMYIYNQEAQNVKANSGSNSKDDSGGNYKKDGSGGSKK